MKHFTLWKSFLLLCALVVGSNVWADDSVLSWSVSGSTESYTTGFTVASNLKSAGSGYRQDNTTAGTTYYISLYNTTSALASSTPKSVTLKAKIGGGTANKTLTTPIYACYVDKNGNEIANTETEITGTITTAAGDDYSISMPTSKLTSAYGVKIYHVKTASYNCRFYSFSLEVEERGGTLSSITLSGTYKTSFYVDDEFTHEGMVVTANYSDASTENVTSSATFSGYDMSSAGNQTVTVSYTEDDDTKTATYDITVSERPKFTVTFSDGGSVTEESVGGGVTLPSRSAIVDYTFSGWSTTEVASETTTIPSIIPAGAYSPTDNITLYPVYTRTSNHRTEYNASVNIADYATANSWVNSSQYTSVIIDDQITASASTGQYTGSYVSSSGSWKIYQTDGGSITIAAKTGYQLSSATFTFTKSNSGILKYGDNTLTSGTAISISGTSADFVVGRTGSGTNGQILITNIEIEYYKPTTTYYTSSPVTTGAISFNSACTDGTVIYGTYYTDRAYVMPENVVGEGITVDNDGVMTVEELYNADDVVPAKTALLLYTIEDFTGTKNYTINYTAEEGDDWSDYNDLKGTLTADENTTGDDCLFYRLTMHNGSQIGFWWGAADGAAFKPGANKAYLAVPTSVTAKSGFTFGGETTGINLNVKDNITNAPMYNMAGQRVGEGYKGLVIVNGKKFINK